MWGAWLGRIGSRQSAAVSSVGPPASVAARARLVIGARAVHHQFWPPRPPPHPPAGASTSGGEPRAAGFANVGRLYLRLDNMEQGLWEDTCVAVNARHALMLPLGLASGQCRREGELVARH